MATTYCTTYDVADFLRIPITANTTPNKAQVEKIIFLIDVTFVGTVKELLCEAPAKLSKA